LSSKTTTDANSCSVCEVLTHQSPLTTKPILISKTISDSGSSQHDDSNNLGKNDVSHSASRDFAMELMIVDKAQSSIISDQNIGF
jgi:hypothetical protein